jgi:hypothetical protein
MTITENRKQDRKTIAQQPKGRLHLRVGEIVFNVRSVVDVSAQGIRLEMDAPVEINLGVRVRYQSDEVLLELNGTTIWCMKSDQVSARPSDSETYVIGVKLVNPTLLHAFM